MSKFEDIVYRLVWSDSDMRKSFFLIILSFLFLSVSTVTIAEEQGLTEKNEMIEDSSNVSTVQSTIESQNASTTTSEVYESNDDVNLNLRGATPFVFENGTEKVLDAGVDITVFDDEGRYIKGPKLEKQDHIIILKYHGKDIMKDIQGWYYSDYYNKWNKDNNSFSYDAVKDIFTIGKGANRKFEVKNFGEYNGKKIKLWFQDATINPPVASIPQISNFKKFPWKMYNTNMPKNDFKFWIEYEDGAPVEGAKILIPFKSSYVYDNSRFKIQNFESDTSFTTVVLDSSIPKNNRNALYVPGKLPNVFELKQDSNTHIQLNFLIDSKGSYSFKSNQFYSASGNVIWGTQVGAQASNIEIFDPNVPILYPLFYPKPLVFKEISTSSTNAIGKFRVKQDLLKQTPINYPDETNPLTVRIKISDVAGVKTGLERIKIMTAENIDVTDQVKVQDNGNGFLEISMWGEAIKTITGEGTMLTISGEFQPDTSSEKFLQTLNNADKYFHIPVEASNSDKGYSEVETNESLIEMPKPAATPIPQTVSINTSTKELKAVDLVKDLSTILLDDKVEIVGFKKDKTFDVIGQTEVIVVIKSVNTGIINEITVPVEVVGNLKFKTVPEKMDFLPVNISSGTKLINREDSEWQISIDNSLGAEWKAYAKAISAEDPLDENFKSSLVFKDSLGIDHELTGQQTLVAEGGKSERTPIIKWQENQGVLFRFNPGTMKVGKYDFSIEWNLETAP